MADGGSHPALTQVDVANPSMHRILRLPGGTSCGYTGFVWHDDRLYISYHSDNEGKISIYLTTVLLARSAPQD